MIGKSNKKVVHSTDYKMLKEKLYILYNVIYDANSILIHNLLQLE